MEELNTSPENHRNENGGQSDYRESFQDLITENRRSELFEIGTQIKILTQKFTNSIWVYFQGITQNKRFVRNIVTIFLLLVSSVGAIGLCLFSLQYLNKIDIPQIPTRTVIRTSAFLTDTPKENTSTPSAISTKEVMPTISATIEPSATTQLTVMGCVHVSSLRVRNGPGVEHGLMGGLAKDDCVDLLLRSEQPDGLWVGFTFSDENPEDYGWVKAEFVTIEGDINLLYEESE